MGTLAPWCCMALMMLAGCSVLAKNGPQTDQSRGALLAASCSGCHGANRGTPGSLPQLQGRSADEIRESLLGFREGRLAGTLMPRLARGYSDIEIDLISDYLGLR